jgi:hypothetical protein
LKCDGTRAETRFCLSAKRTSPFKSAGASVQSTTGSRGVRISGINAGYTMFRGCVKSTGYPLHSSVSPLFPLPCVTMCHHISSGLYRVHIFWLFCIAYPHPSCYLKIKAPCYSETFVITGLCVVACQITILNNSFLLNSVLYLFNVEHLTYVVLLLSEIWRRVVL